MPARRSHFLFLSHLTLTRQRVEEYHHGVTIAQDIPRLLSRLFLCLYIGGKTGSGAFWILSAITTSQICIWFVETTHPEPSVLPSLRGGHSRGVPLTTERDQPRPKKHVSQPRDDRARTGQPLLSMEKRDNETLSRRPACAGGDQPSAAFCCRASLRL